NRGRDHLRPRFDRPDRRVALGGHRGRRLGVVRGLPGFDRPRHAGGSPAGRRPVLPGRRPDRRALRAERRGGLKRRKPALPRRRVPFTESVETRRLSNGAFFLVLENHFNPTIALSGGLAGGAIFAPPDRRMIASVTAEELLKGSERRSKLEIAGQPQAAGGPPSFFFGRPVPLRPPHRGAALSRGL